jgi:hypothetical protein
MKDWSIGAISAFAERHDRRLHLSTEIVDRILPDISRGDDGSVDMEYSLLRTRITDGIFFWLMQQPDEVLGALEKGLFAATFDN